MIDRDDHRLLTMADADLYKAIDDLARELGEAEELLKGQMAESMKRLETELGEPRTVAEFMKFVEKRDEENDVHSQLVGRLQRLYLNHVQEKSGRTERRNRELKEEHERRHRDRQYWASVAAIFVSAAAGVANVAVQLYRLSQGR
jgi:hypothetical protein